MTALPRLARYGVLIGVAVVVSSVVGASPAGASAIDFGAPSGYPVTFDSQMAVGDVNGDGHPDIAVASDGSPSATVFLNNGDGTFTSHNVSGVGGQAITLGDVNRDGRLDLVTGDNSFVHVAFGNGDGTFGTVHSYSVLTSAGNAGIADIAVAQLSGSLGPVDIVTADFNSDSISILPGRGAGSFGPATVLSSGGHEPDSLAVGDLNGDGRPEVVVTNERSDTSNVTVFKNSSGALSQLASYPLPSEPRGVHLADLDGDGHLDIIAASADEDASVLLGTGQDKFAAKKDFGEDGQGFGIAVGDVDQDGLPDIVATTNFGMAVLYGRPGPGWGSEQKLDTDIGAEQVAVADFNGDGDPDLALIGNYFGGPGRLEVFMHLAPDTVIDSGPADGSRVTTNSVTFTYHGDASRDTASFKCSLDGSTFATCPATGISYAALTNGSHTFAVRALDRAANADPTPASVTFKVAVGSRLAQTITFTSAPPSHVTPGTPYTVTATGGGSGNPVVFAAGTSSATVCTVSSDGIVTFTGHGTCRINATQAGNATYRIAPAAKQIVVVFRS